MFVNLCGCGPPFWGHGKKISCTHTYSQAPPPFRDSVSAPAVHVNATVQCEGCVVIIPLVLSSLASPTLLWLPHS